MTFLWDANVLVARAYKNHPHHRIAFEWTDKNPDFAMCPITEGALVRHAFRTAPIAVTAVKESLGMFKTLPGYQFWADDISYLSIDLESLRGHKQVTDAYLVALASAHGGRVATFDSGLAAEYREVELIPVFD